METKVMKLPSHSVSVEGNISKGLSLESITNFSTLSASALCDPDL